MHYLLIDNLLEVLDIMCRIQLIGAIDSTH